MLQRRRENGIHTLGYLELEIHSARGLKSVQSNGADPYVVVQQAGRSSIKGAFCVDSSYVIATLFVRKCDKSGHFTLYQRDEA